MRHPTERHVWRLSKRLYVMRTFTRRGWLVSLEVHGWLFEGCTWWRLRGRRSGGFGLGVFWIGRKTYA